MKPMVVPLIALAVFINYVDRGNLATAAPLIKDELGLSATQLGVLLSAFFWSYVPAQILSGWLSERVNPYRTLALGLAIWSIATGLMGLVSGFATLMALRVLLGLGESAAIPCAAQLLAQNLPPDRLGSANGTISVGLALGPAFGTLVGGLLMARVGWRPVFLVFGLASLLWLAPWYLATRDAHALTAPPSVKAEPSFADILRRRDFWGASLGQFCSSYALYFLLSWVPLYLVNVQGLSVALMARVGGAIYLIYAASAFLSGRWSDRWIRAGANANQVRKGFMIVGHATASLSLMAASTGLVTVSVVSLLVAGFAFGLKTPTLYAIGQTLAGPRAAGKWMGLQNSTANLAGILAPIVTGVVIDRTGHYSIAFFIAAGVAASGILCWGLLIRRIVPLAWRAEPWSALEVS